MSGVQGLRGLAMTLERIYLHARAWTRFAQKAEAHAHSLDPRTDELAIRRWESRARRARKRSELALDELGRFYERMEARIGAGRTYDALVSVLLRHGETVPLVVTLRTITLAELDELTPGTLPN